MSQITSSFDVTPRRHASPIPYIAAVFLSAALVFMVQPMFAKMATPLLGGSPSVWNVSLVCFQAALLLGYLYAHAVVRFIKDARMQVILHTGALLLGGLVLPLGLTEALGPADATRPTLWLIGVFALSIAPPFAVLSATAPLTQAWYARTGRPDAHDPYYLYGASNIGSVLGLALYPLVMEPLMPVAAQSVTWSVGYGVLGLTLVVAGLVTMSAGKDLALAATVETSETAGAADAPITWRQRLTWVVLAFIPSSLLVGASTHISVDVAAAPFLWAPPLMVYLLSFILVFAKRPVLPGGLISQFFPLVVAAALLSMARYLDPFPILVDFLIHLTALFFAAMVCHGVLVSKRPQATHLTEFYLLMSLGGVLGGAFNALIAPVAFNAVIEYPIMLIAALFVRPALPNWFGSRLGLDTRVGRIMAIALIVSAISLITAYGLRWTLGFSETPERMVALLLGACCLAMIVTRGLRLGPVLAASAAWMVGISYMPTASGFSERGFFGVVKVAEREGARIMLHGTTLHGAQLNDPEKRLLPATYYSPNGAMGQTLDNFSADGTVGVIGLGVGSLACYKEPGQVYDFYEIDPIVVRLARDPDYFTFMSECAPDSDVIIGDGRLTLANQPEGKYDILVVDAFSSDSVPAHLLTVEAVQLYLSRTAPDGVILIHVSNRYMRLNKIVARVAADLGLPARVAYHTESRRGTEYEESSSEVVMLARTEAALDAFTTGPGVTLEWEDLESDGDRPWTDDYSNVLGAILAKAFE